MAILANLQLWPLRVNVVYKIICNKLHNIKINVMAKGISHLILSSFEILEIIMKLKKESLLLCLACIQIELRLEMFIKMTKCFSLNNVAKSLKHEQ